MRLSITDSIEGVPKVGLNRKWLAIHRDDVLPSVSTGYIMGLCIPEWKFVISEPVGIPSIRESDPRGLTLVVPKGMGFEPSMNLTLVIAVEFQQTYAKGIEWRSWIWQ